MKRFTKAGALAVLVLALTAVAVPASAAEAAAARCDEGHWPATVQGKPASFHAGGRAGYYIWHDRYGWHLRTTTPVRAPHSFTGKIVSAGNIKVVRQFKDEGRDTIRVSGNTLTFSFVTYNGVDGVDFKVGCTPSLSFALKSSGRWTPASRIWLGYRGTAPSNPFTVRRVWRAFGVRLD